MSDRRHRPIVRCQVRGCPHAGTWPVPYCPEHWPDIRGQVIAEVQRRQTTPELTPLDVARELLAATPTERKHPE